MDPSDDRRSEAALSTLLDAERARPGVSVDRTERALGRVAVALALSLRATSAHAPARRPTRPSQAWTATVAGALLGVVLASSGGAVKTTAARVTPTAPTVTAEPPVAPPAPPAPPPREPPRPIARPSSAAPERETPLLERARAAMLHGRFSVALESLDEHARRFPRGRLEAEREAMRVQCLVAAGRAADARAAAGRFHARFHGSPLGDAVDAALAASREDRGAGVSSR